MDNAGGYGTVILRPFAADEGDRVECSMHYHEEDEGGEFDDEECEDHYAFVQAEHGADVANTLPTIAFADHCLMLEGSAE